MDLRRFMMNVTEMKNTLLFSAVMLAAVAVPLAVSLVNNDGFLIYTLDDPYIHLTLASEISRGHYGINPGEYSAPSSSIIWPFILAPFASAGFYTALPLILNLLFALGTVAVFSRTYGPGNGLIVMVSIFAFNLAGLVLTGMEHSIQVLLTAAAALGLTSHARRGLPPGWLYPVLFLAPLVRYECLAVSLPALAYLFLAGRKKAAVITLLLLLAALGLFSLFLMDLGLDPMPSSVFAKSSVVSGSGTLRSIAGNLRASLSSFRGFMQTILLVPLVLAAIRGKNRRTRMLAGSAAVSVILHLLAGRFGWFHRYGVYIWMYSVTMCFFLYRKPIEKNRLVFAGLLLVMSADYLSGYLNLPGASSNIYRQQYQMRRFVHHWLDEPVAVNDLGLVAMGAGHYVLDLWGLASPGALEGSSDAAWVDSAAVANSIRYAVVYRDEIEGIQHWTSVARMELHPPLVVCPSGGVDFLSAPWGDADSLSLLLQGFAETLPRGIDLVWFR